MMNTVYMLITVITFSTPLADGSHSTVLFAQHPTEAVCKKYLARTVEYAKKQIKRKNVVYFDINCKPIRTVVRGRGA